MEGSGDNGGATWTFSDLLHAALTDAAIDVDAFGRRHAIEPAAIAAILAGEPTTPDTVIRLLDALDWQPTNVIVELHGLPAIPRLLESRPVRLRVRRPPPPQAWGRPATGSPGTQVWWRPSSDEDD